MRKLAILFFILGSFAACRRVEQAANDAAHITDSASPVVNSTNAELEAIKTPCDDAATHEEAETCLRKEFDRSEAELNQLYNKILNDLTVFQTRAKAQDESLAEKYKTDHETLRLAQDYWVNYRKFNCKAERESNLTTPNSAALGLSCFERMTAERIENLKFIYENK